MRYSKHFDKNHIITGIMPPFCTKLSHRHDSGLLNQTRILSLLSPHKGIRLSTICANFSPIVVLTFVLVSFIVPCLPAPLGEELSPGWLAWKYPNPRSNPDECGWTDIAAWAGDGTRNVSWLCDPDHVLGYHEAYNLALLLDRYHREAPCDCSLGCQHGGYQIAVALVERINTDGEFEPMIVKSKDFGDDVRASWFNDLGCDDNVLIFYSYFDDELYISLGSKAMYVISDLELVHINDLGDRRLTGEEPTTPSPLINDNNSNNNMNNNNNNNDERTTVNDTQTMSAVVTEADIVNRQTSTYAGLETLVTEVHLAIMNGPSVSSQIIYAAAVPVILFAMVTTMCLLANWCCRPMYGYEVTAIDPRKEMDDDDDDDDEEEEDEDEEAGKGKA